MSDKRVDRSLQKKMEKNDKSARTHPAYWQSWDTLFDLWGHSISTADVVVVAICKYFIRGVLNWIINMMSK
jgi:hypothetical protein